MKRTRSAAALKRTRLIPCLMCGGESQACHITSKGARGGDTDDNLLPMCFKHHREQHDKGWVWLVEKYPHIEEILFNKGFRVESVFGRKKLAKIKGDQ